MTLAAAAAVGLNRVGLQDEGGKWSQGGAEDEELSLLWGQNMKLWGSCTSESPDKAVY